MSHPNNAPWQCENSLWCQKGGRVFHHFHSSEFNAIVFEARFNSIIFSSFFWTQKDGVLVCSNKKIRVVLGQCCRLRSSFPCYLALVFLMKGVSWHCPICPLCTTQPLLLNSQDKVVWIWTKWANCNCSAQGVGTPLQKLN